jgi:hypothetical protein
VPEIVGVAPTQYDAAFVLVEALPLYLKSYIAASIIASISFCNAALEKT